MERTQGVWSVLKRAAIYSSFQNILGADDARREIVARHVQPRRGLRVLDVGCGPCDILPYLGEVAYTGVDRSANYIETARDRFGDGGQFICRDVANLDPASGATYDLILAFGLLHHLEDEAVSGLMSILARLLDRRGKVVMLEPVREPNQHPIARAMIALDRGRNVRTEEQYVGLISKTFQQIATTTYHDLIRLPYSHLVIEAGHHGATD